MKIILSLRKLRGCMIYFFGNENKYLKECISSGFVSYVGNFVNIFEDKICKYTKSKHSIAISGTAALHLALV